MGKEDLGGGSYHLSHGSGMVGNVSGSSMVGGRGGVVGSGSGVVGGGSGVVGHGSGSMVDGSSHGEFGGLFVTHDALGGNGVSGGVVRGGRVVGNWGRSRVVGDWRRGRLVGHVGGGGVVGYGSGDRELGSWLLMAHDALGGHSRGGGVVWLGQEASRRHSQDGAQGEDLKISP